MNIVVVTPPPVEPVTIEEAFVHLRLDDPTESNPDFAAVQAQIVSAREQCEQITRRAFVQQTLRLTHGSMPPECSWLYASRYGKQIELLRPPLISLTAVRYYDVANVLQTVDPSSYVLVEDLVPRVLFSRAFDMSCTYERGDALQVEYVAGYAPVPAAPDADPPTEIDYRGNIPASIKQAILLGVQLQYDELTPEKRKALEGARDALLSSYRIHTF